MSKASKVFYTIGTVLILILIFGLSFVSQQDYTRPYRSLITTVLFAQGIIGVIFLVLGRAQAKKAKFKNFYADIDQSNQRLPESQRDYFLLSKIYKGRALFKDGEIIPSLTVSAAKLKGCGGKFVELEPEDDCINVIRDSQIIAEFNNADMAKYLSDGILHVAYINKVDVLHNKISIKFGLYAPLDKANSQVFPLVRTGKTLRGRTTREDNLKNCDIGSCVVFWLDDADDIQIACDENGNEIGELRQNANEYIDGKNTVGVIENIDLDTVDGPKATVRVYQIIPPAVTEEVSV